MALSHCLFYLCNQRLLIQACGRCVGHLARREMAMGRRRIAQGLLGHAPHRLKGGVVRSSDLAAGEERRYRPAAAAAKESSL